MYEIEIIKAPKKERMQEGIHNLKNKEIKLATINKRPREIPKNLIFFHVVSPKTLLINFTTIRLLQSSTTFYV